MRKEYSFVYPSIEKEQFDLTSALISMLNCRRYIRSQGFQEVSGDEDINGIAGGSAVIVFPDGSTVGNREFKNCDDRDSLLEHMISKNAILKPERNFYKASHRAEVVTSTFRKGGYGVNLRIRDTTRDELGLFRQIIHRDLRGLFRSIFHDGEKFAFFYHLTLDKEVIKDPDIRQFEEYLAGLEDSTIQPTLLEYSPAPQRKTEPQEPPPENHFINPWEVKIPKLGEKGK